MMKQINKKIQLFLKEERGAEFLEVAAIIIGAVILVGVLVLLFDSVQTKIEDAGKELDIP